jgi:two-component sensor histidine kinase
MMRKLLFFLLALGGYWAAKAQPENIAGLEAQLVRSSDPAESIRLLEQLTDAVLPADLKRAETYAAQALRLAGQSRSELVDATAFLIAGKTFVQLTKLDSANLFLDWALAGFERLNEPNKAAEALYWKGYIAANSREFSAASRYYFRAIENWQQSGQQKEIALAYSALSDMFSMQDAYNKAIEYAQEAISILEALGETALLAAAFDELSYSHVMNGNYDIAYEYAEKALLTYEKAGADEITIARALNSRGNALKFLDRYGEAIADYERSKKICEKHGVVRGVVAGTANIGHTLLMQKKYAEALPYIMQAIEMMTQAGDVRNLAENYMHASDIHAGLGDFEKANSYAWLYAREKERQHQEKEEQLQEGLAEKYQAGQRAATIVLQEQRIQQQTLVQQLMFGLAGLLALTLIIGWRNYRIKQRANRRLAEANGLLDAKNLENELLLKEIHHRVKNNLQTISSLLSLQSESIQDQSAWDAVQESKNRVNSMALLHQKLYQGENLAAIEMRDYFETIGKTIIESFGEKAENVSLQVEMPELELDVDTAVPIGLITNELVTNSLKYAFPGRVKGKISINLRADEDDILKLHISDNGRGNADEQAPQDGGGFGTLLVQLLTAQLGGQLEKSTEAGTAITIRFPKQEKSAA